MLKYSDFLTSKRRIWTGTSLPEAEMPSVLFAWQAAIVAWARRKGRCAVFADCGLGKTFMQLAWAMAVPGRVLLVAPLCVAEQTSAEAAKLGLAVTYVRTQADVMERLSITNYERLDAFDASQFAGVVLDESSILKAFDGKTRTKLIAMFQGTQYRLCCTATPSPNDIAELANHAEFLGLMTRAEFLATWFVHDDEGWRMKRHAREAFFRWLASWAVALRKPSDIGFSDEGFTLPPLRIHERIVPSETTGGVLFPELGLHGLRGRLTARRESLTARIDAAENLVDEWGVSWLVWCGLNEESAHLARALSGAVEVQGSDTYAEKVGAITGFCNGSIRRIVSKVKILGYGLNFQHCSHMAFVGLGDSYEQYYQAIRRCWRFGQRSAVDVHVIVSEAERVIVANIRRKEAAADALSQELLANMADFEREELIA